MFQGERSWKLSCILCRLIGHYYNAYVLRIIMHLKGGIEHAGVCLYCAAIGKNSSLPLNLQQEDLKAET